MYNQDYLIHYGVQGMRWGFRKRRPKSSTSSRTQTQNAREKARRRAERQTYRVSKKAARAFYKKDRTDNFQDYKRYDQIQNRQESRLNQDQIATGRYKVARARNIKRKVLSAAVGSATTIGLASIGAGVIAPILGSSLSALTNGVTGGMYYSRQASLYGKQRSKIQKALAD